MTKLQINFWFMAVVGIAAGLLLGWMLYLAVVEASVRGPAGIAASATVQHKVGELMIAIPLFLTAMFVRVRPRSSVAKGLMRAWPVTIMGAGLNLLAWFNTIEQAPWTEFNRLWFAGLVVVGVVAPPLIASALVRRGA